MTKIGEKGRKNKMRVEDKLKNELKNEVKCTRY